MEEIICKNKKYTTDMYKDPAMYRIQHGVSMQAWVWDVVRKDAYEKSMSSGRLIEKIVLDYYGSKNGDSV